MQHQNLDRASHCVKASHHLWMSKSVTKIVSYKENIYTLFVMCWMSAFVITIHFR